MTPELVGLVVGVCVGATQELISRGRIHRTAFVKEPMTGPVALDSLGLAGDEHEYHEHGGPDQALLVYSIDHYPFWEHELGLVLPPVGAMAENLTVEGLTESEVHIGDTFAVGETLIQVTSPRGPCYKLGVRFERKQLPRLMQDTCHTGYLMRVLQGGLVEAGMEMRLVSRPADSMSVAEAARVVNRDRGDWPVVRQLASNPLLAEAMRSQLEARLRTASGGDDAARLFGEGEGVPIVGD